MRRLPAGRRARADELRPGDARIYAARGYCYERLDRVDDALDAYDKAVTAHPDDWHHHFDRGRMLLARQHIDACLDDAETVLRLAPERPQGYRLRALGLMRSERLQDAQRDLLQATALQPDDAETCLALADCQAGLQEFQEAIKSLCRAEKIFERTGDRDGVAWVGQRIRRLLGAR